MAPAPKRPLCLMIPERAKGLINIDWVDSEKQMPQSSTGQDGPLHYMRVSYQCFSPYLNLRLLYPTHYTAAWEEGYNSAVNSLFILDRYLPVLMSVAYLPEGKN